jgi:RHS repeat-associated protein
MAPTPGQASFYWLFAYDANGNMTHREHRDDQGVLRSFDLKWDGDDNLREADQQGVPWLQATYNGDGLRVHKHDARTPDHDYTWGLGGVLYDTSNATTYTPGVSQNRGGTDLYFDTDWLGSTRYLTDSTGNSAPSALRYDAFGVRTVTLSGNWQPTDFQFDGAFGYQTEWSNFNEPGLGLQYLENRYYDPGIGRFISPDPIRFVGGLNTYDYADADPVNEIDPSGRSVVSFLVSKGAEFATKELLEAFIRDRIRSRVKKLVLKQFARGILINASGIEHTLNDPWWITALELIPIGGDILEVCNEGRKAHEVFEQLDALEAEVDRIAGFESANRELVRLSGQAGKDAGPKGSNLLLSLARIAGFTVRSGKEHQVYEGTRYVTAIPHSLNSGQTGRSAANEIVKAALERFRP